MKEYIKSYHVFVSPLWLKCVLYVVYPVLLTVSTWALINLTDAPLYCEIYCMSLLIVAEVLLEYFAFGGIISKDTNKLEYIKTSVKGLPVLEKALLVGELRRLISIILITVLPIVLSGSQVPNIIMAMGIAVTVLFTELGILLVRKVSQLMILMLVSYLGELVAMGVLTAVMTYLKVEAWMFVFAELIGAAFIVGNIKLVMRKARDSYYDDRNQKESEAS